MKKHPQFNILRAVGITLIFVLVAMAARTEYEARYWLRRGTELRASGNSGEAIESLRRAESWYVPGFDTPRRAYEMLEAIVHDEATPENLRGVAIASTKRGLSASRSMLDGISGRRQQLSAVQAEMDARVSPEDARKAIVEISPPHFDVRFQLLAQCMFTGWIACVLLGIWKSFDRLGNVNYRLLTRYLCGWAVFFASWIVALRFA